MLSGHPHKGGSIAVPGQSTGLQSMQYAEARQHSAEELRTQVSGAWTIRQTSTNLIVIFRFKMNFEAIVGLADYAQRVNFKKDLVCKVELGGRLVIYSVYLRIATEL